MYHCTMEISPYNFEEFLTILGERESRDAFHEVPFPSAYFDRMLRHFHFYTLIGGIPEVVETFAKEREPTDLPPVYERILAHCLNEIRQTASAKKTASFASETFYNIFPFAAMRIFFNNFSNSGRRSRDMAGILRLLEKCNLLRLIYPTTAVIPPVLPDMRRAPRLQIFDTGIVNYASDIQRDLFNTDDLLTIFDGQIARHITGQEILASGFEVNNLNFWVREKLQSSAEVDFLVPFEKMLIPVILKNGEPGRLRSLHQFMDIAPHPYAVRLWAHPLSIQQSKTLRGNKFYLMSLPYFLAGKIREHLDGFIRLTKE
jgi:uncharacterized protein